MPDGTAAPVTVNRAELARAFKVALPTVDRWIQDGCPVEAGGGNGKPYAFRLEAVRAWRDDVASKAAEEEARKEAEITAFQQSLDLEGGEANGVDALTFRRRREFYEAEAQRIRVGQLRGEFCRTEDVRRVLERTLRFLADRLQSLPDQLERQAGLEPETVDVVVTAVDEFQDGLARELADAFDNDRPGRAA